MWLFFWGDGRKASTRFSRESVTGKEPLPRSLPGQGSASLIKLIITYLGNAFDEQFKVTIGGEDFKLNVMVPNIDDITMRNKDGNKEKLSLSVPPPLIPVNVLLPLYVLMCKFNVDIILNFIVNFLFQEKI